MRKGILFLLLFFGTGIITVSAQIPELTEKEIRDGWVLLFDGKTTQGWKSANGKPFPEAGWKIEPASLYQVFAEHFNIHSDSLILKRSIN